MIDDDDDNDDDDSSAANLYLAHFTGQICIGCRRCLLWSRKLSKIKP